MNKQRTPFDALAEDDDSLRLLGREIVKRMAIATVLGLVLGVALGVVIGWVLFP